MQVIKTFLLITFLSIISTIHAYSGEIISIDSLIEVSKDVAKMDSVFFAKYIEALNNFPNQEINRKFSYTQKGIALAEKTQNNDFIALMTYQLAQYYGNIDSVQLALAITKDAYGIAKNLEYKLSMAGAIANYATSVSEYQTSAKYYLEKTKLCDQLNRPQEKGIAYCDISELYLLNNNTDRAEKYSTQTYHFGTRLQHPLFISHSATLLGRVFQNRNQLDSARFYYEKAIDIMRGQDENISLEYFIYFRNHAYYHLSRFHREIGEKKKALLYADSSLLDINVINILHFEFSIQAYSNIAKCYLDLERFGEAEAAIFNIENKVKGKNVSLHLQRLYYEYKVQYAVKKDNYKSAFEFQQKLEEVNNNIIKNSGTDYFTVNEKSIIQNDSASNKEKEAHDKDQIIWLVE